MDGERLKTCIGCVYLLANEYDGKKLIIRCEKDNSIRYSNPKQSYTCQDRGWRVLRADPMPKTCTLENLECRILWNSQGEPEELKISFNAENKRRLIVAYGKRDIKKLMITECDYE